MRFNSTQTALLGSGVASATRRGRRSGGLHRIPGVAVATVLLILGYSWRKRASLRPEVAGGIYFCESTELCEPSARPSSGPVCGGVHVHATHRPTPQRHSQEPGENSLLMIPLGYLFRNVKGVR